MDMPTDLSLTLALTTSLRKSRRQQSYKPLLYLYSYYRKQKIETLNSLTSFLLMSSILEWISKSLLVKVSTFFVLQEEQPREHYMSESSDITLVLMNFNQMYSTKRKSNTTYSHFNQKQKAQ